jgi:pimeloyl-ACP methyl ester carboxylesterase
MDERDEEAVAGLEPTTFELAMSDGRTLAYCLYGPDDGVPVIFHYGTPGVRLLSPQAVRAAVRQGVRLLVSDRPGYGGSTRRQGRRVADVVEDVSRLADALGWDRFATWGGSGGAPHALACAALLADRVRRCASVVGPAPFDAEGLDWFAGMSPGNVEEFTRARSGEAAYRPLVERLAREAVASVEAGELQIPPDYELPEADLVALRGRLLERGHRERTRMAYLGGVDGWIDDIVAMTRSWGFQFSQISAPVSVWYGPDDVLSPRGHAEWLLAHVPGAERRELPTGGHLLDDKDLDSLYAWLTSEVF